MRIENVKIFKLSAALLATTLLAIVTINVAAQQQYKNSPVTKARLVNVLRSKSLQTREIVIVVTNNGVDFKLDAAIESELTAAGARPAVIEAVRGNYRQPTTANNLPDKKLDQKPKPAAASAPLTKDAVLALLQNRISDQKMQQNVKRSGVAFQMSPAVAKEIKAAGGSDALVGLMFSSYKQPVAEVAPPNVPAATSATTYDSLIDSAVDLYDNKKDKQGALAALNKALKLDADNPRAFQLLGYMTLYGMSNFTDAEKFMREAQTRGGSAVFRVTHDHNGTFTDTCEGSLYVAKDSVRFESDDNKHTFDTPDANIKQVKMNSSFKRLFQTKSGSYKIVLNSGEDKDGIKFSFAPLTNSEAESKMVIRLIGKN